VAKKEWIKTSFWMPENTPEEKKDEIKPPSTKFQCPYNHSIKETSSAVKPSSHTVKFKELVSLKINKASSGDGKTSELICWVCSKNLGF